MGVSSFFKWLVSKYPRILTPCVLEEPVVIDGAEMEPDLCGPNPNGVEFDHLYIDMNGLVHPCCHPEASAAPRDEAEMVARVFRAVDDVVAAARPRRLLYLAFDGVAPRAKMNQQRGRRFKSAQDRRLTGAADAAVRALYREAGWEAPPERDPPWDHNVITPGTPFMEKLMRGLEWYIHERVTTHPLWRRLTVIFSPASVPGEGEHKIIDFVRQQRLRASYDPNTSHCLHGLDADLIMLALATHEPRFTILRDHVDLSRWGPPQPGDPKYDLLHISVLREYLAVEFQPLATVNLGVPFSLERAIDDFVFLCFFVGNDFLPHLPSLDIRTGAIDRLQHLHQELLPRLQGWLTDAGEVHAGRVAVLVQHMAQIEDQTFRQHEETERWRHGRQREQQEEDRRLREMQFDSLLAAVRRGERPAATAFADLVALRLKQLEDVADQQPDTVRLGVEGWKPRYYASKLGFAEADLAAECKRCCVAYWEGLRWVMRYYYQGCPSWTWYYPYHYAPFASDLLGAWGALETTPPDPGEPFTPFGQLMGVLPPASKHALPQCYHSLMESDLSPIKDFYPAQFNVDLVGKRYAWQGIVCLPFIEEARLLAAIAPLEALLTPEERQRNARGTPLALASPTVPLGTLLLMLAMGLRPPVPEEAGEEASVEPPTKRPRTEPAPGACGQWCRPHCMTAAEARGAGAAGILVPYPNCCGKDEPYACRAAALAAVCPAIAHTRCLSAGLQPPKRLRHRCQLHPKATPPEPMLDAGDRSERAASGLRGVTTQVLTGPPAMPPAAPPSSATAAEAIATAGRAAAAAAAAASTSEAPPPFCATLTLPPTTPAPSPAHPVVAAAAYLVHDVSRPAQKLHFPKPVLLSSYQVAANQLLIPGQPPIFRPPQLPVSLDAVPRPFVPKATATAPSLEPLARAAQHARCDLTQVDVITLRTNLTKVLATPFAQEEWEIGVRRTETCLVLDARAGNEATDEYGAKCSRWGCVFEAECTETEPGAAVNPNDEFCGVFQLQLNGLRLVVAAELDCYDAHGRLSSSPTANGSHSHPLPGTLDLDRFVEVKTHKPLVSEQDVRVFNRHKALKVFLQSFVVGVPHVFLGRRTPAGEVRSAEVIRTTDLAKGARDCWHYAPCFDFAAHVLQWLRGATEAGGGYRLRYGPPFTHLTLESSEEPPLPPILAALLQPQPLHEPSHAAKY